jgi:hypothetical protein
VCVCFVRAWVCPFGGWPRAAKNLVLAGVRSVTLHDDSPVALSDLSAQVRALLPPWPCYRCSLAGPHPQNVGPPKGSWRGVCRETARARVPTTVAHQASRVCGGCAATAVGMCSASCGRATWGVRVRKRAWTGWQSSTATCPFRSSRDPSTPRPSPPSPYVCTSPSSPPNARCAPDQR